MNTNNTLEYYAPEEPEHYEPPQEVDYTADEVADIEAQQEDKWDHLLP